MKTFSASTHILASPEAVWALRIEGTIAPGEKVTAYTKFAPDRAFPATVTEFVPEKHMAWTGGMPLGLFKGVRTFDLTPRDDGSVDFEVREAFSGLLLPIFGRSLPDMDQAFEEFVTGLKERAEAATSRAVESP